MSYTIEVYRGHQKAERHFGIYSLYVMFYPQLVAGPIERPQNLLHQFREKHDFNSQQLLDGFRLMLWGLFKKVVVADRIAHYVNVVFEHPGNYHYLNLAVACVFFAIQIYCDFSGYSDMAIGAAKTMGFNLMTNFNRPYFAKNIQEFWRKWHISLSTWFKDYFYVSLGGNRKGIKRMYINVAAVFLVSGFWHGANWTFIIWGGIHAFFIILYMLKKRTRIPSLSVNPFLTAVSVLLTFAIVCFAWIFFRAANLQDAVLIAKHLLGLYAQQPFMLVLEDIRGSIEFTIPALGFSFAMIAVMFAVESKLPPDLTLLNKYPILDFSFFVIFLVSIVMLGVFNNNSFIYFQF